MKRKVTQRLGFVLFALSLVLLVACSKEESTSQDEGSNSGGNSGEEYNFIVSHFLPGAHPLQEITFPNLASDFNEQADGNVAFEYYPGNALGDAGSHYDMVVTGEADIAISVHGYTPGRFPSVSVLELPFLAESAVHGSKIIATLYEEFPEIQQEHEDTKVLTLFTAEPAQFVSKSHKIEKPEDLKGLRVRTPSPLGNTILEELGATPISMPMSDVYESLERGVIDVALVPLETLYNFSFHEIAKYVTIANVSATPFFATMNLDAYDSLSDTDKGVLDSYRGIELAGKSGEVFDADGEVGLEKAIENGAEILELSEEEIADWKKILEPVTQKWIADMESQGIPGEEIYKRAIELKEELN